MLFSFILNKKIKTYGFLLLNDFYKTFFVIILIISFLVIFLFSQGLRNLIRNITALEDRNLYYEYKNPFK